MVIADQVHGRPTMVTAMMSAATTQAIAIHKPPKRIQSRLSSSETGDMWFSARKHLKNRLPARGRIGLLVRNCAHAKCAERYWYPANMKPMPPDHPADRTER